MSSVFKLQSSLLRSNYQIQHTVKLNLTRFPGTSADKLHRMLAAKSATSSYLYRPDLNVNTWNLIHANDIIIPISVSINLVSNFITV